MLPQHHKEVAKFLADHTEGGASVHEYTDDIGEHPIPVGCFGKVMYSTIGICDTSNNIPQGYFEFAAFGTSEWLPNAIVSSIYWLTGRSASEWPLVCEDAVRANTKNNYRHMAYVPSLFKLPLSNGRHVQWLLGVPIADSEINLSFEAAKKKAKAIYPKWLFNETA